MLLASSKLLPVRQYAAAPSGVAAFGKTNAVRAEALTSVCSKATHCPISNDIYNFARCPSAHDIFNPAVLAVGSNCPINTSMCILNKCTNGNHVLINTSIEWHRSNTKFKNSYAKFTTNYCSECHS